MARIRCFTELEVWKKARNIRERIYSITRTFPRLEQHGLAEQMRRAAVSLTSNIAEGHGKGSWAENKRYCRISRGSASELRDHLITADDERYIREDDRKELDTELISLAQMLSAYIRSMTERQASYRNNKSS